MASSSLRQASSSASVMFWNGGAVGTQVEADELHDALAAHDVAAVVADDVDDLLREVLQLACLLYVARVPGVDARLVCRIAILRVSSVVLPSALLGCGSSALFRRGVVLFIQYLHLLAY